MVNLTGFRACFLIIAGPSGVGKDYLIKSLITDHPELFYKVDQVTTRKKRDEFDNGYIFLSKEDYEKIRHLLLGKTTVNGEWYGSIFPKPELKDKLGIIILNYDGYMDFLEYIGREENVGEIFYVGVSIDKRPEHIKVKRENRDEKFLEHERRVSEIADVVIELDEDQYASIDDILNAINITANDTIISL